MEKNVIAVDFGGSNGRVILGRFRNGELTLEEIHRFPNQPIRQNNHLSWNFEVLCEEMLIGLGKAFEKETIDSIGIDTWGVDYGLLNQQGELLAYPIHYRDKRTSGYIERTFKKISEESLYLETGNQIMEINTIFQLLAEKDGGVDFGQVDKFLFMPDLFNYYLTGIMRTETTIASTSQLLNPKTKEWAWELIDLLGLPRHIFPTIVPPQTKLGWLRPELNLPRTPVYNVCSHDTASAVASVPSERPFLFVSCGTWSLVGTELKEPNLSEKALKYDLTNESGINGTTRFLKNITGLWILQEVKRAFEQVGKNYSYADMEQLAYEADPMVSLIDSDDSSFSAPGKMVERIQEYARDTKQEIPKTDGAIIRCIYESLAFKYKYTFLEIIDTVGYEFDSVNLVGGGSKSTILCEMVAAASGLTVFAGPDEATAIGNINVQLLAHGAIDTLEDARAQLKKSHYVTKYLPKPDKRWDKEFGRYKRLIEERNT